MANQNEDRDLREKNSELVQEVQFWKMTAAQRDKEKLDLMKELNDLRLKLSRLRSGGAAEARKLDAELQSASEEALTHLVQASGAVARSIELAKQYMRNREELDLQTPRWSNLSGATTPNSDSKVNKVPPMSIGGQSIQPVVALRRTLLNASARSRSPNQNTNVTERAVPMHVLQDVYIPLTRIDMADLQINAESDIDNSTDDLGLQETSEQTFEESQNNITEDMNETRRLDDVIEEAEPEEEEITLAQGNNHRARIENPLEGPSWLLDRPQTSNLQRARSNLEPDSTTCDQPIDDAEKDNEPLSVTLTFTPTVRRRRRTSPPPANSNRVLKVVVAKMRLSNEQQGSSPPKIPKLILPRARDTQRRSTIDSPLSPSPVVSPRRPSEGNGKRDCNRSKSPWTSKKFDEPSPNGSTDAAVVVSATSRQIKRRRSIYFDSISDVSEDDRNVCDNDVNASDNNMEVSDEDNNSNDNDSHVSRDNSKVSENSGNAHRSSQRRNNSDRNVTERHNVNRHDTSDDSQSDEDVRVDNKDRKTQRDTKHAPDTNIRNAKNDIDHLNVGNRENSENEEFRGFASETRDNVPELNASDGQDKFKNVTKSRGNNVTNNRGKNVTNNRGKNVTDSRDSKANVSREKKVAKRNTSERHETSVTENHSNSRHDESAAETNVSGRNETNVSGRKNGRSVAKRYASDRHDGNVSDDVDSDTSNSETEWGRGRSRRNKKKVTYTEVPLNRKMRR